MRFNRRIGVIAGLLATTALVSTAVATTVGAAAPPPIDVSNDHVTCTSFYGSFKLTVPLQLTPVTPVPTTANLKGTLDGCTDTDNANVHIAASKITGAYTYAANGAGALAGVSTITNGSLTVTWKTAAKTAKLVQGTSTVSFTQINGGPSGTPLTFSDSYGLFQIGNDPNHGPTAAPSVTGAFTGGDSGANSTMDALTSQSITAILGPSGLGGTKGLTGATIGIGQLVLG